MAQTWIFNCNPKEFDLPGKIAGGSIQPGTSDFWWAKQSISEMKVGDRAFHWVTGDNAGIYAVSHLTSNPYQHQADGQTGQAVDIQYESVVEPPLLRAALENDPLLSTLTILRIPRQTNYLLSCSQGVELSRQVGLDPLWPFSPEKLSELLEMETDDPVLRTAQGWQETVASHTQPFLKAVSEAYGQRQHETKKFIHSPRRKIKNRRQSIDSITLPLENGWALSIYLGLDDKEPANRHVLFSGLATSGSKTEVELRLSQAARSLPEGVTSRLLTGLAYDGSWAVVGRFLTPEEVRSLTPEQLLKRVVDTLLSFSPGQDTAPAQGASIEDLYARSKRDEAFWDDWRERCAAREGRIVEILTELVKFQQKSVGLDEFCAWMSREGVSHNLWGFRGSGQRFLNQLTKASTGLPSRLADFARSPNDLPEAQRTLDDATDYVALQAGKRLAGFLPFVLSFFWQIQAPERWPVMWPNTLRPFLVERGLEYDGSPAEKYSAYYQSAEKTLAEIQSSTHWDAWATAHPWWELEGLATWAQRMGTRPIAEEQGSFIDTLASYFRAQGYQFSRELLASYAVALQSKPFVILSGISGTGKTKLAELFARFISPDQGATENIPPSVSSGTQFQTVLRPSTLRSGRVHIPMDAWQQFLPLERGRNMAVRLFTDSDETECKLFNYRVKQRPEGVYQIQLKGRVLEWMKSLTLGDRITWKREAENTFRLQKEETTRALPPSERKAFAFVPVRPDWTDNRGLLGFANLLTGTYQATDFLRLLQRAAQDPERWPHFVLLDEMNLARVEHYFSDFLSALETRKNSASGTLEQTPFPIHDQPRCLLQSGSEDRAQEFFDPEADHKVCRVRCSGCPWQNLVETRFQSIGVMDYQDARLADFEAGYFVPPRVEIPWNVFFTGTVNVDETTYTFSPKVLDRAFVFEFHDVDLESYFEPTESMSSQTCADADHVRAWIEQGQYPFVLKGRKLGRVSEGLSSQRRQLSALNRALEPHNSHFGYRVADEILTFLQNALDLGDPALGLDRAFDRALLQKIVPRFHGSIARLRSPLLKMLAFCVADVESSSSSLELTQEISALAQGLDGKSVEELFMEAELQPRLPLTAGKILSLLRGLELDGFASSF